MHASRKIVLVRGAVNENVCICRTPHSCNLQEQCVGYILVLQFHLKAFEFMTTLFLCTTKFYTFVHYRPCSFPLRVPPLISPISLPFLKTTTTKQQERVTKSFLNEKKSHVGMESSKPAKQDGYDTIILLVPFFQLCTP